MRAHLRPLRGGLILGLPVAAGMALANFLLPIGANLWDKYIDKPQPQPQPQPALNTAVAMQ